MIIANVLSALVCNRISALSLLCEPSLGWDQCIATEIAMFRMYCIVCLVVSIPFAKYLQQEISNI